MLDFTKISPVGAESFHADGRTDEWTEGRTGMTKLIVAFRNFANAPNKRKNILKHTTTITPSFVCEMVTSSVLRGPTANDISASGRVWSNDGMILTEVKVLRKYLSLARPCVHSQHSTNCPLLRKYNCPRQCLFVTASYCSFSPWGTAIFSAS
jgi:hypothetical protein